MENLKGKNALITGGSRGLGKAVAVALAKLGVNIAITGRNESTLVDTAAELATYEVKVAYAAFDISNEEQVKESVNYFLEELGTIDVLINNAGIASFGSVIDMPSDEWVGMMQTNLFGTYYMTKAVLPQMIERKVGDIMNVSSTAGLTGNANTSAYSASKFAVTGFTESLMREVRKHDIRVTTLFPSTIASDMSLELGITDGNPNRVLQPEDFAQLVISTLSLPRRAFVKSVSLWSTNP